MLPNPPTRMQICVQINRAALFLLRQRDDRSLRWVTGAAVWSRPGLAAVHFAFTMSETPDPCTAPREKAAWEIDGRQSRRFELRRDALISNEFLRAKISLLANNVSHTCLNKAGTIHRGLATAYYLEHFGGESYDRGQMQTLLSKKILPWLYLVWCLQWKPALLMYTFIQRQGSYSPHH